MGFEFFVFGVIFFFEVMMLIEYYFIIFILKICFGIGGIWKFIDFVY